MKKRQVKDMASSVHQRLLDKAQHIGRPFNELLQYYAMERFLYRLSKSAYADRFILKDALMLTVWEAPMSRPTRDMDFLGRIDNDIESIVRAVMDVCSTEVEPDGIDFDPATSEAERIAEGADYQGVRVRFRGSLGRAQISMQFDVAFGDLIVPSAKTIEYPTIIEMPHPVLLGYSMESVIAEKFEVMVKLGILNSRMKDFFDIWLLSRQFDFSGETLASAVLGTFDKRGTAVSRYSSVFTAEFGIDASKTAQWRAFMRRTDIADAPLQFSTVVEHISAFLGPVAEALVKSETLAKSWRAGGAWQ